MPKLSALIAYAGFQMTFTLYMLGNFACSFVVCLIFTKLFFSKNSFSNTIRLQHSLDPGQSGHIDGSDLGPNCAQR